MVENPAKEYWKRMWLQAYANVPCKIIKKKPVCWHWVDENGRMYSPKNWKKTKKIVTEYAHSVPTEAGKASTLMLLLGKPMKSRNDVTRSHKQHFEAAAYYGHRPRDPEVRRKLEIIAGPNGKLMAWLKLKELGLAAKYQEPG